MATPNILLASYIAALEDAVVLLESREEHGNLQFRKRTKEAEVEYSRTDVIPLVMSEISLELEALRVLMIDIAIKYSGFIGTRFIRKGHIIQTIEISSNDT